MGFVYPKRSAPTSLLVAIAAPVLPVGPVGSLRWRPLSVPLAWAASSAAARRARGEILCGYCILAVTVIYKAHIFVASAFPLLVYPCFF